MNCSVLFRCLAVIKPTTFGGFYRRTLLPEGKTVPIRRVLCLQCRTTHALLPSFLLGRSRYAAQTLGLYIELAQSHSQKPVEAWQQKLSDGPEDLTTLYRWFRRLRTSLATLLPLLHEKLLELAPDSELEPYQTAVLTTTSELSPMALCQLSFWLAERLLSVSSQLLGQTPHLSTVSFLNYLCWQKNGWLLLSPPEKPPP